MRTILFDLDGTVIDPALGLFACIRYAFEQCGEPPPDEDALRGWIGPPLHHSFEASLGNAGLAASALDHYRERYEGGAMYENTLYPGISELIKALHGTGHRLFIATSKPVFYAKPIIERHGLASCFVEVCGAELDGVRSDKTELLAWIVERHGLDPTATTMIGDRRFDMIGARNNGIAPIGVTYGYGSVPELRAAGAAVLCSNPAAIWSAVI
jgi:phosphoglycolate phosphatase